MLKPNQLSRSKHRRLAPLPATPRPQSAREPRRRRVGGIGTNPGVLQPRGAAASAGVTSAGLRRRPGNPANRAVLCLWRGQLQRPGLQPRMSRIYKSTCRCGCPQTIIHTKRRRRGQLDSGLMPIGFYVIYRVLMQVR